MQSIFVTDSQMLSPRWQQAFPQAIILDDFQTLPSSLVDSLVWIVLDDELTLADKIPLLLTAGAKVVALTRCEDQAQAKRVLEMGMHGYLHYLAVAPVLLQVAQVVELGGLWLGADLMRQLVMATAAALKPLIEPSASVSARLSLLSLRERAVVDAVAVGKTNKEAARDLAITERTVKAHLSAAFEKLRVRDRLQLVLVMSGK